MGAEEYKNTHSEGMKKNNLYGSRIMNGGVAIIKHLRTAGLLQQGKWEAVREEV
jgi:hypothetical protein